MLDPIGRAGRGRRAPAERGLRAVHQAVLRHFAATGFAPGASDLAAAAAEAGRTVDDVLAELAAEDFLTLNDSGRTEAAYPFSAAPTPHRMRLANGVEGWAMCAIDALGVAAMLHQDGAITSCAPLDDRPITVTFTGGTARWDPVDAVVFVGQRAQPGPAATVCCGALNFFADPSTAEAWALQHPDIHGSITGKSHLLIALGTEAAVAGFRVRYTLATKLVNELVEAADERVLTKTIARYGRVDLALHRRTWLHGAGPQGR